MNLQQWNKFEKFILDFKREKPPGSIQEYLAEIVANATCDRASLVLAFRALTDEMIEQIMRDHEWIGSHSYVPGSPDEYEEICKHCGMANPGPYAEQRS